jgi:acetyl esterase/lipase
VTSRRFAFIAAAVGALVLAGAAAFAACGSESSDRSERRRAPASTTSTPAPTVTTVAPQTIPVPPLPPAGPTTAPPPAITVPRGTTGTTPPTVTAAPATTGASPSTTKPTTSTTKPGRVTRKTVVYSPPGAPKLRADLVLPRDHADTIIVLAHPSEEGFRRKTLAGWANFYAQQGYPSLAIDVPTPRVLTRYPQPQTDVKAAVQYLQGRAGALGVDPNRIVVQGFDIGAGLGAQALVTPNDPFFAGARLYPNQSDKPGAFIGFSGRYDGGGQRSPEIYYGGPPNSRDPTVQERYAKADSISRAAGAAGPALLVQGDAESPELVASATAFRDALQNAGKDVTLALVPGAGPAFDQNTSGALTPAGKQAAQQVLEWLGARFPSK